MNIKRLCLIAGLFCLPVANANAAEITIKVPVELTNVPAANSRIIVYCEVGVGAPNSSPGSSISFPPSDQRGIANVSYTVPGDRNIRSVANVKIDARDGATHYICKLNQSSGEPNLDGANVVTGPIPKGKMK